MRRLAVLAIALVSVGAAQIGAPFEQLLGALEVPLVQQGGVYQSASGLQLAPQLRSGVLYRLSAEGTFDEANQQLATALIVQATGYTAAERALAELFAERLGELAGRGRVNLQLGIYLLGLTVSGASAPYEVALELFIQEADVAAFPEARHSLGPADARYVIREFSDFQCPFCARFALEVLPELKAELLGRGDVRFEFHHFPLRMIHQNAQAAAEAAECVVAANTPEDFWRYHAALFERLSAWRNLANPIPYFVSLAAEQGLATEGVRSCLLEGRFRPRIEADFEAAVALGLRGTPSVFVGSFKLEDYTQLAAYLELMALIDAFGD